MDSTNALIHRPSWQRYQNFLQLKRGMLHNRINWNSGYKSAGNWQAKIINLVKNLKDHLSLGKFLQQDNMFFIMNVSNTKRKSLVLVSSLEQNLNKIRKWLGAPALIMAPLTYACHNQFTRGGVEDTRLEAKDKDTKKIWGQGQPFRG